MIPAEPEQTVPAHLDRDVTKSPEMLSYIHSLELASPLLEDGNQIYHPAGSRVCAHRSAVSRKKEFLLQL